MTSRREFLGRAVTGLAMIGGPHGVLYGQEPQAGSRGAPTDSMPGMSGQVRPVRRPDKPGANPSMSDADRDALEHRLHCQCGTCTLDVYTCRTTDFTCQVSPAMHRDVMALVRGGYGAQEIIDAFVDSYGERVLMSPKKSGFNLLAWITPGAALLVGAGVVAMVVRRWRGRTSDSGSGGDAAISDSGLASRTRTAGINATADELARVAAAVKGDDPA